MKDKVSPMRDSSARSAENLPAASEKLSLSSEHSKVETTSNPVTNHPQETGHDTGQSVDNGDAKDSLKITDLDKTMSGSEDFIEKQTSLDRQVVIDDSESEKVSTMDTPAPDDPQKNVRADNNPKKKSKPELMVPKKNSKGFLQGASNWSKLRTIVKTTGAVRQRPKKKGNLHRQDSFLKKFSTRQQRTESDDSVSNDDHHDYKWRDQNVICAVIHPDGTFMFYWLAIVTLAVLYNWWTCIAREGFREIQDGWEAVWFTFDAVCDTIYVLDIVVQFRTGYLEQGLMVYDGRKLRQNYYKSSNFYLDIISLFPLDLIQIFIGIHPMIRFPRFLKTYRTLRFMYMLESRAAYPNLFRVANLTHLLFLGSHWFAAFYYLISEAEGFVGDWAYPYPTGEFASVTRKYLMSLYWSTLTLTTIGDLPPPDSNWEYVFVIVSYLIGVFVFATIVGQVGNVITNRNASRQEFEKLLDGAKSYMRMHNVPPDLQKRVQRWYDYVWSRGRLNGSWDINSLGLLPDKLKTELALHVNLETLKKVTIFQECQPEFLHDLVLKMKAYIFTPGDLICRSGEIAREMFIIADGVVEVISESGTVLTQMSTGDFFGEIGILNLDGGINRRTADVRSVGYSELFVLSREDVLSALKDHPEAELILKDFGTKRLLANPRKSVAFLNTQTSDGRNVKGPLLSGTNKGGAKDAIKKIIRDYGQQRLQEIEADRQKIKVKPADEEEDAEDIDLTLLSPLKRHVHFNSFSPMMRKRSRVFLDTKVNERRKSCAVEYYRPRPVNGLVNFLQRKLSAGSAFCGVFQASQMANQNRVHGGSAGHDSKRRTSSLAGSADSVGYERENLMRGILSKTYDSQNSTDVAVSERPIRPSSVLAPPKHGFKGVYYTHVGSDDPSDSESSVYGSQFSESCKLLPVEESVQDENNPTPEKKPLSSSHKLCHSPNDGFSSASDCDLQFPCMFAKSEKSTKIANVFLQHLVTSQKLRRKSFNGRLTTGSNVLDSSQFATRRKTVYDISDATLPFSSRQTTEAGTNPVVPSLVFEQDNKSMEHSDSEEEYVPYPPKSSHLTPNKYPALSQHLHTVQTEHPLFTDSPSAHSYSPVLVESSGDQSQLNSSFENMLRCNSASSRKGSTKVNSPPRSNVPSPRKAPKDSPMERHLKVTPQGTTEFRVEQLMGDVQGLIVNRLSEIAEGFMSKVKLLEDDNLQKDDKIQELEMKVRDLQIELSMAHQAEHS